MFKVLTGEKKRRAISPATITASVAVHLLLGGALFAAAGNDPIEVVQPICGLNPEVGETECELPPIIDPPPPPVQPTLPRLAAEPVTEPVPGRVPRLDDIRTAPDGLTDEAPRVRTVKPLDYRRDGQLGTVIDIPRGESGGPVGPRTTSAAVQPDITPDAFDMQPVLARDDLSRVLERHYPAVLRDSRVSGRVVIELVVDEEGLPIPGSARVVEASHPAFGEATLRAVERFRFRPATIGGTPVPAVVTIPILWTVPG
ncbi:MAG TPA: TonB family protein [Longimicrobium sp.]|jgi:TonB family protein|uniref:energy transducer TonB n=1 Tax=Longimicrobium sp. TaxID=2029185 RepID=UPI002ED9DDEE